MIMVFVVASASLIPVAAMIPSAQWNAGSFPVGAAGATVCVAMTWFWWTRWPTRRVSLVAVLLGSVCATLWSLTQSSPGVAALACACLTVTGGYIAFFHNLRFVAVNAVLAIAAAVVAAIRLAPEVGVAAALAAFWMMWFPNSVIPLGVRCLTNAMTHFAIRSDEDPLTGLLNRRGFRDAIRRRLITEMHGAAGCRLVVVMIDLDDFKRVNDTLGHAAGDRALLRVAELLRARMPPGAVLCRCGGEEFLVAVVSTERDAQMIAAPVCEAIRSGAGDITASIGVATADDREILAGEPRDLVDRLIEAADHAMYDAKRQGGDRVELAR
ncbi:GGDEF domain-containing protein [Mycobacterium sp. NPDC006124]|uniref:GGDEF domain-containing protein n=1 Tax=Mycobacterium sp. NPDC006124 TaxID=3156729 RepID=UPI0033AE0DC8